MLSALCLDLLLTAPLTEFGGCMYVPDWGPHGMYSACSFGGHFIRASEIGIMEAADNWENMHVNGGVQCRHCKK